MKANIALWSDTDGRKPRHFEKNQSQYYFFPPHNPHGLTSDRTRSTAVRAGRITIGHMTLSEELVWLEGKKEHIFKIHMYGKNYVNLLNVHKNRTILLP